MNFHPYSEVFPLIEGADFDALVSDIQSNGLQQEICLYKGQILDGRNRFLACKKVNVTPRFTEFSGTDEGALAFVVSANVSRRHLSLSERAFAAARIAQLRHGGDRRSEDFKAPIDALKSKAPAGALKIDDAAEKLKVSPRSVDRAKKVLDQGSKALKKAAESGEVSLSKAASVVDLPKSEQIQAAKQPNEPAKAFELEPVPDFDFTDYEPEDDEEYKRHIENVMMADDKLEAMREELKQVHREMQGLRASRDHYQNQAGAAARLVKARDRQIEKLEKQLAALRGAA